MERQKNHENKKDHITIPKSTLKQYETTNHRFSYLDLKSMQIYEKGPSQYHKKYNYFPKNFDKACQSFEIGLGNLRSHINKCETQGLMMEVDRDSFANDVKELIALQVLREPETLNYVMDKDYLTELLESMKEYIVREGRFSSHAISTINSFSSIFENAKLKRDFFFDKIPFNVLCDSLMKKLSSHKAVLTRIPQGIASTFLLTPFHFTQIKNSYNLVLMPRYAIFLCPLDTYEESFTDSQMLYDVTDGESIEFLYQYDMKMARMAEN